MRYTVLLFCLIGLSTAYGQVKVDELSFETEYIDFGQLNANDGSVTAEFKFKNNSAYFFIIQDIDVACGCTTPQKYEKRIAPGDSGVIRADFNPKNQYGDITKWIHVKANFKDVPYKELRFKALVTDDSRIQSPNSSNYYPGQFGYLLLLDNKLPFGEQFHGFKGQDSIGLMNDGDVPFSVTSIDGLPSFISVEELPLVIEPKATRYLHFSINTEQMDTVGLIDGSFTLITDDRFYPGKEMSYAIELRKDFRKMNWFQRRRAPQIAFDKRVIDMGIMNSGQLRSKTIKVMNNGRSDLKIYRINSDCACTGLESIPKVIKAGETIDVTVNFDAIFKEGPQRKAIVLFTNDPKNEKITLIITAMVNKN